MLDGYSVIYRSYFAFIRNPLRNPRGENSSAVFGFVRTLVSIFREHNPSCFAVVMDSRVPTFRHEKYPEYKANREAAPEDLHAQVPVIEEILKALGVALVQAERYEADDLIAALAERCRVAERPCRIISGDKDLLQLVGDPVRVLRPAKNGLEELDREGVYREWNVWPEQILDFLALTGDSSDNVPGVAGIGAKTAADLLSSFETLQGIYDNLDSISSKSRREKLEEGRESAWLSRDLISLSRDAPVPEDMERYRLDRIDYAAAAPLLLAQGMRRQVEELGLDPGAFEPAAAAGGPGPGSGPETTTSLSPVSAPRDRTELVTTAEERTALAAPGDYELVDTLEALDRWIARVREAGVYAFDVETDSLDPKEARLAGFSISTAVGSGCYVPLRGPEGSVLPEDAVRDGIKLLLGDDALTLIGQNFKYDWQVLHQWNVPVARVAFDTMIAAWLVDTTAGSYGMDRLARDYLGYETVSFSDLFEGMVEGTAAAGRDHDFARVPLEAALRYAAEDADITFRLYTVLDRLIERRGVRELFETVEMPLLPILATMELEGIGLDAFALEEYSEELTDRIGRIEGEIHELVGRTFNIGSTKQLQEVLFTERKLQPVKKTKTGYSTDNSVLQELAREDPVPEKVLRYRMLTKLRSTYVDALPRLVSPRTGRIHTSFNQTGTATGRLSSTDPNLQNIPIREEEGRRIRNAFIPREGHIFVSADYSQIELVILAHLSGDAALREAFESGEDVHRRTAGLIFGVEPADVSSEQRRIAKTINFGVMYGMSAFRLSNELGIPRKDADAFIKAYFGTYSGIRRFIDDTVARVEREGEVRTLLGRPRPIPDINNRNRTVKAGAERVAVNTPIQGSAADIVKKAMLALRERLDREELAARLILQVHDELILECPREEEQALKAAVLETMSTAAQLSVPLRVSVESGERWGELHQ